MPPRAWAGSHGIPLAVSDELPPGDDFRDNPSLDFGRLVRRVPAYVLRPRSTAQLAECLRHLAAAGTPYKLRGAGHSSSGEVLTDGGAVVDLAGLAGVVADDPAAEEITVLGGTTWLAAWEHLAAAGMRPPAVTDNPRTTVAGTLSMGGVGDASHLHGTQVAGVRRLVLVTPDGARREARPGDPFFDHALCGHGQLGALAEVTLATWRRPSTLVGRVLQWGTVEEYLADAATIAARGLYDYLRGRLVWDDFRCRVWAIAARMTADGSAGDETLDHIRPSAKSRVESLDLLAHARVDPIALWTFRAPCVELVFPYPEGLAALRRVDAAVAGAAAVRRHLPRGSSLMLVPGTRGLPLSPFVAPRCVVLAIRPEPPTLAEARACEPFLRAAAEEALAAGGRVYLSSFPLAGAALARQLGDGARSLAALKAAVDPAGLCNRGNLHGWEPSP
ncbi:MAG TPA: FAD-binding oxidoreductase [Haliangiales bacterium]|nr:FAD-binding oxidoreductase [Haliangiales bacterium]